jgi:hypothetical protein
VPGLCTGTWTAIAAGGCGSGGSGW